MFFYVHRFNYNEHLIIIAEYEDEETRGARNADLHHEYSDRGQRRLGSLTGCDRVTSIRHRDRPIARSANRLDGVSTARIL